MAAAIPVTILGGYLGAGKTTLLNAFLRGQRGSRIAVMVNDFGSVNVDAELIESHDGETIALSNGCVCCTIGNDLAAALAQLARAMPAPDAIVVEASGVADPEAIARLAACNAALRVDGIIVLADAQNVIERAGDKYVGELVVRQLHAADVVALSKADACDAAELARVKAWLGSVAPAARAIESRAGDVAIELLDAARRGRGWDPPGASADTPATDTAAAFRSLIYRTDRALDRTHFTQALVRLPASIVRAKGLLVFSDDLAHHTVLQMVGKRVVLERGAARDVAAVPSSYVVAIAVGDGACEASLATLEG